MPKHQQKASAVHSTLQTMVNTTIPTRVLAHQLLQSPNTGASLTPVQLQMLFSSPVSSLVKNTILANMMYAYLLHQHHLRQLEELLQQMGLREEMLKYYRILEDLESADRAVYIRSIEDEYQEQNVPRKDLLEGLEDQLKHNSAALADALLALTQVQSDQQSIVQELVQTNNNHLALVMNIANQNKVQLTPAQAVKVLDIVPQAKEALRAARATRTPQEEIKALGLFNTDGLPQFNLINIQNFMNNNALNTSMSNFKKRVEELNTNYSAKNIELVDTKLRCLGLEQKIDFLKGAIEKVAKLPEKAQAGIAPEALQELANQVTPAVKGQKPSR